MSVQGAAANKIMQASSAQIHGSEAGYRLDEASVPVPGPGHLAAAESNFRPASPDY